MEHSRHLCPRCGGVRDKGADRCESCAAVVEGGHLAIDGAAATAFLDTVHLPPIQGEPDDERIVRPSLAIPFRLAVGPAADYYAPRFLEFERIGRSFPSWNWASPWAPAAWAFYHKLWGAGLAFALWPVATMAAFGVIDPYLDDSILASLTCAVALLWLVPGLVAALTANSLLYRKTRRLVRKAEAETCRPEEAARLLGKRSPIAPGAAALLGGVATVIALFVAAPNLQTAVADRVVRTQVAQALATLQPLQRKVEDGWDLVTSSLIAPNYEIEWQRGADSLGAISVNRENGRVRVALGPLIPELAGRWILLAPTLDRDERVRWICVPVDIPARYLPQACRQG